MPGRLRCRRGARDNLRAIRLKTTSTSCDACSAAMLRFPVRFQRQSLRRWRFAVDVERSNFLPGDSFPCRADSYPANISFEARRTNHFPIRFYQAGKGIEILAQCPARRLANLKSPDNFRHTGAQG